MLTLGSLFDSAGTFPFAAQQCGVKAVWASEIESFSVEVDLRRLTPTECGRLQGMPDWWCEDIPHSDSAEYKMWGNGMALPCVLYVMENVVSVLSLRLLDSLLEVSG